MGHAVHISFSFFGSTQGLHVARQTLTLEPLCQPQHYTFLISNLAILNVANFFATLKCPHTWLANKIG
jgi:hypothetical protein